MSYNWLSHSINIKVANIPNIVIVNAITFGFSSLNFSMIFVFKS